MIHHLKTFFIVLLFCGLLAEAPLRSQDFSVKDTFQDLSHPSKVFGYNKYFRLYLPKEYQNSNERFPVIYFFHGWGGRHFMDDNALLEYKMIKTLVDKYRVILVMWDGNMDGIERRPYNVGNREDIKYQVQMKDYFPELVAHIDSAYRTLTGREHRGTIGFSMGGFMSLFLAGEYPHRIGSIVSLAGSPEFFVGYPSNHTLYPVRYTFKNLQGVDVRIHNGDSDILYYLNDEVYQGALWDGFPLDYWKFHGGHMVDKAGETKVFEMAMKFISNSFEHPSKPPQNWTHFGLYQDFDVWGYEVKSNKQEPGYITLRNVNKYGMGIYTQRWLPLGPSLDHAKIDIKTPPVYLPNQKYTLVKQNKSGSGQSSVVTSDNSGSINFQADGSGTEIGIFKPTDHPYLTFLDYSIKGGKYLKPGQPNQLQVKVFNRVGEIPKSSSFKVLIKSNDPSVKIADSIIDLKLSENNRILTSVPVTITCNKQAPTHATPAEVKFYAQIYSGNKSWNDDFLVPVMFDAPYFQNVKIDDGFTVRDTSWGMGNADGLPNAGEKIMVYEGTNRLRLYTDDTWVIQHDERLADEVIPAIWPDGYTFSSIIHISPDCPAGHEIECLASYETKTYNPIERKVVWGKIRIRVK